MDASAPIDPTLLERIAGALERMAPPPPLEPDFSSAEAFVWQSSPEGFSPVTRVNRVSLALLKSISTMRDTLLANTLRFAQGFPANNALLWGARGMGKSSLVKAVHAEVRAQIGTDLKLLEIHREDIGTLPRCLHYLRDQPYRFIIFCDDLSFDADDTSYKSLKAVLEGGIEGRPENVLFYATSNRRHLLPRDMMENERSTAINPYEAVEEKVSLSDRFGLWIGFHNCAQADYLEMVCAYASYFGLKLERKQMEKESLAWAMARGSRSGRVAWQFIQDLAGRESVQALVGDDEQAS
jgi:uncharacterized protein